MHITRQLRQVRWPHIHHVARVVILQRDVPLELFRQPEVVHFILGFVKRRRQVVYPVFNFHLQIRIGDQSLHQIRLHVRRARKTESPSAVLPVPLRAIEPGCHVVVLLLAELQFLPDVVIEPSRESAGEGVGLRVVERVLRERILGVARKPRVQPPRVQAPAALQLRHELRQVHAQVVLNDVVFAQSRELRELLGDCGLLRIADCVAFHQSVRVLAPRELPRLLQEAVHVRRAGNHFVIAGRRRVAGNIQLVREVFARIKRDCPKVQNVRHQNDSVQIHPVVRLQVVPQRHRAKRPVALANQELRRIPPVVPAHVGVDELRQRADVRIHAPEILVLRLPHGVAESRPHRVDENFVALVNQRILVVHQLVWSGRSRPGVRGHDAARAVSPHVDPDRR